MASITPRNAYIPWTLVLVLVVGVMLPTACVIWFMGEAVKNERLAVHKKIEELYLQQLDELSLAFTVELGSKLNSAQNLTKTFDSAALFSQLIQQNISSSAIIYHQDNTTDYPTESRPGESRLKSSLLESEPRKAKLWDRAERLELQQKDYSQALTIYNDIARSEKNIGLNIMANIGSARCLTQLGKNEQAIRLLAYALKKVPLDKIQNEFDYSSVARAYLYTLTLAVNSSSDNKGLTQEIATLKQALRNLLANYDLTNYDGHMLSTPQRIFMMQELRALDNTISFPTLEAEKLAIQYIESGERFATRDMNNTSLEIRPSSLSGVYKIRLPEESIELLLTEGFLQNLLQVVFQRLSSYSADRDVQVFLIPPDASRQQQKQWIIHNFIHMLPGWQIGLSLGDSSPFNHAAEKQISIYLWTAVLIIVSIFCLALVVGSYIATQLRKNRYKNDLIATVSHELKTPLASIRLLVDTLLQDTSRYDSTTREYLELVNRENSRLGHLIDNFLTFSRMERDKQVYHFTRTPPKYIAEMAASSLAEKFKAEHVNFELKIADQLPFVYADKELVAMAITNLLENAVKYSSAEKRIIFYVTTDRGNVNFIVQDFGIGIASKESRKIFGRFYRVDNTLTQEADGCGLGLNIVSAIAKAHQGKVLLQSEPGKGSTFTLSIPIQEDD